MAANHQILFSAIVIAVHIRNQFIFLARGDAFKTPLVAKFLNGCISFLFTV
jgi:hypothetical protein